MEEDAYLYLHKQQSKLIKNVGEKELFHFKQLR